MLYVFEIIYWMNIHRTRKWLTKLLKLYYDYDKLFGIGNDELIIKMKY